KIDNRRLDFMTFDLSADGKVLIAGASDNGVLVYDLAAGKELLPDLISGGWVGSVDYSSDGKTLAVGYADHSVRLADSRTGRVIARSVLDAGSWVKGLAFAPDGRTLAAATMGPTVHLLDAKTASPQSRLKTPGDAVRVAFARNGTLATVQQDGTVRLWN